MRYNIIESHQVYDSGKLVEVSVLWESNTEGSARATYITKQVVSGYKYLLGNEVISNELLQEVAGYGMKLPVDKMKIYFNR